MDLHLLKPGQEKAREIAHLVDVHCNVTPRIEAYACKPGPGEVETGQSLELAYPTGEHSTPMRDPVSNKKVAGVSEMTPKFACWLLRVHTCACTPTYKHATTHRRKKRKTEFRGYCKAFLDSSP